MHCHDIGWFSQFITPVKEFWTSKSTNQPNGWSRTEQNRAEYAKHAKVKNKKYRSSYYYCCFDFISMLVLNIVAKWHYYICVVMVITLLLLLYKYDSSPQARRLGNPCSLSKLFCCARTRGPSSVLVWSKRLTLPAGNTGITFSL